MFQAGGGTGNQEIRVWAETTATTGPKGSNSGGGQGDGELAGEASIRGNGVFCPEQQRITLSDLLDALEADYKLRSVGTPQLASHLKYVRAHFGYFRAIALTAEQIDKFIVERLQEGYRPATINRNTQLLTQAYKLAIERKRPVRRSPHPASVRTGQCATRVLL